MPHRKAGILQRSERGYLAKNFPYPFDDIDINVGTGGDRYAKSRIHNEVASIETFPHAIRTVRADFWAIHLFKCLESQESREEWENVILPAAKSDLERLRDQLDKMINAAESTEFWEERKPLKQALDGLGYGLVAFQNPPDVSEDPVADVKEYKRRRAALYRILSRPGLSNVLEYIYKKGETYLPKREIGDGGQSWRKAATDVFVKELHMATKKEKGNKYQLNERGTAIAKAWLALKECDTVTTYRDDYGQVDEQKVVQRLLIRYFNAEEWTDVEFDK